MKFMLPCPLQLLQGRNPGTLQDLPQISEKPHVSKLLPDWDAGGGSCLQNLSAWEVRQEDVSDTKQTNKKKEKKKEGAHF